MLNSVSREHPQWLSCDVVLNTRWCLRYSAAAAKSLQSCPILCDPKMAAHQAPPSLGFSRQEHWSGLPFPSPMHESEKWKGSHSVMLGSSWPHGLQPTRLLRPWDFPSKSTGVGCHCLLLRYSNCLYFNRGWPVMVLYGNCSKWNILIKVTFYFALLIITKFHVKCF